MRAPLMPFFACVSDKSPEFENLPPSSVPRFRMRLSMTKAQAVFTRRAGFPQENFGRRDNFSVSMGISDGRGFFRQRTNRVIRAVTLCLPNESLSHALPTHVRPKRAVPRWLSIYLGGQARSGTGGHSNGFGSAWQPNKGIWEPREEHGRTDSIHPKPSTAANLRGDLPPNGEAPNSPLTIP